MSMLEGDTIISTASILSWVRKRKKIKRNRNMWRIQKEWNI